ncbi:NPCBM/NEW2 domain-containing protein, partial [Clostridium sp.]|uniref:NPCBM/NEW2 domain-containing protein n=1 Tax=Clostridium sp. TaxID=1506 RepID=UPI001B3DBFEE
MNKKVQSLVLAGIVSVNALTPIGEVFADSIKETSLKSKTRVIAEKKSGNQIYLSDIDYMGATTAWGEVRKDTNVEGNGAIKLIIDGETVEFGKGMAAHANSSMLYNVSNYSGEFTRLTGYLGVDASRG